MANKRTTTMRGLWRPIAELRDRYAENLILCAPELLHEDFNPLGVGTGYYQDGVGWRASTMDGDGDSHSVVCHPTHFIVMRGPGDD